MDLITWVILVVLLLLWLTAYYVLCTSEQSRERIFPPGPGGLNLMKELISNLSTPAHIMLTNLATKWGEIFSMNIFGQRIIVLSSPGIVGELFTSKEYGAIFAGRPHGQTTGKQTKIATTFLQPNIEWVKQRKLIHKVLNFGGEDMDKMENTFNIELRYAIDWLEQNCDVPIDIDDIIHSSVINFLTIMLVGKRHDYGSKELGNIKCMDESTRNVLSISSSVLFIAFPFLKYIPIGVGRHLMNFNAAEEQFVKDFYATSKDTYDPNMSRGMADDLFRKQNEGLAKHGGLSWLTDSSIKAILLEMIIAGSFTIRSALYSFFLIILNKPEVAKRIQDEIEAVVGSGRFPSLKDRAEMPYTVAAIFELLRYTSNVPIPFPRTTTEEVRFRDYVIPANTLVIANTWAIHHEETLWPEPWEFRPERFLGEEGKILPPEHVNRRNLVAFGLGKRSCVGEAFARSRIFEFITAILQRYDFYPDVRTPLPSADPRSYKSGLDLVPTTYHLCVKARH